MSKFTITLIHDGEQTESIIDSVCDVNVNRDTPIFITFGYDKNDPMIVIFNKVVGKIERIFKKDKKLLAEIVFLQTQATKSISDRTPLDIWIDIVDIKPVIDTSNYKLLHCVVTLLEKSFGQEYTSYPIRK